MQLQAEGFSLQVAARVAHFSRIGTNTSEQRGKKVKDRIVWTESVESHLGPLALL